MHAIVTDALEQTTFVRPLEVLPLEVELTDDMCDCHGAQDDG